MNDSPFTFETNCDVCGRRRGTVVCASGVGGAVSWAYCEECYKINAEPESSFEFLWSYVGDHGQGLHESVSSVKTWKDGRYWTWGEWDEWRKDQPDAIYPDEA